MKEWISERNVQVFYCVQSMKNWEKKLEKKNWKTGACLFISDQFSFIHKFLFSFICWCQKMDIKKGRLRVIRGAENIVFILTVDASIDPPNQTAYLCMWWVMTCTSMGLGCKRRKRTKLVDKNTKTTSCWSFGKKRNQDSVCTDWTFRLCSLLTAS